MHAEEIIISSVKCSIYKNGTGASIIYYFTSHNEAEAVASRLRKLTGKIPWTLVCIHVQSWNDTLSPWKAKGSGDETFGGMGNGTLSWLLGKCIPEVEKDCAYEKRFIGGYSLAGLFSLWAFIQSGMFCGVASVSGSLWFEGWDEYIKDKKYPAESIVYLSLGLKEEKTINPLMALVGERTRIQYEYIMRSPDVKDHILEWNNGGHFTEPDIRTAKAFAWLIKNNSLSEKSTS